MREGTNVRIVVRERGKLRTIREAHNTITLYGRQWLAEMVGYASLSPDTPERSDRIKYLGFGIGGAKQSYPGMANGVPLTSLFPAGSDPQATAGNEYNPEIPESPEIGTLERPVTFQGFSTQTPVYAAPDTKVWRVQLKQTADFTIGSSHPQSNVLHYEYGFQQGVSGSYYLVFNPPITGNQYHLLPLSEMGLFLNSAPATGQPFAPVVAYVTFDTIQISQDTDLFVSWDIVF